ncbi:glycosyltransferase [Opitutaceae bacterium TAV1]|nr:glycosyltransferase [Opitutaceae bacterium TAV1]
MRICHFTNTFLPHIGGVARAVQTLLEDQRRAHHRVLVVAPEFADGPAPRRIECSVERIAALKNFNDSDFSVRLPAAATFSSRLANFKADILHSHHPFLLGETALREAASRQVPLVFTHHTLYEHYTHYLPFDSGPLQDFAAELATRYANRCDTVIAPSESVRDLIVGRGVEVPVHVVPTGIDTRELARGNGARARKRLGIPARAFVIGHLGRLAAEKNPGYLADALARALSALPAARALIVGDGPAREDMQKILGARGVLDRVVFTGSLRGAKLRDACAAMDLFAFASTSETQGLVLAEVMASATPVVALDASGAREVVEDGRNGRLLATNATPEQFSRALAQALKRPALLREWSAAARATAARFDRAVTSRALLGVYAEVRERHRHAHETESAVDRIVNPLIERIATEGRLIADKAAAVLDALA